MRRPDPAPLDSVAAAAWVTLIAVVSVQAALFPHAHTVFDVYAEAARQAMAGADLYALGTRSEYRYSPLFALAVTPFAALPEPWGNALWKLVNATAGAAGLLAWCRGVVPSRPALASRIMLLALPFSLISAYNGQANMVTLALMLGGLHALASGRASWAAAALAAGVFVKGYPLALLALVAVLSWRVLALRAVVAVAAGLALPFALADARWAFAQTARWLSLLAATPGVRKPGYRSFDQLWQQLGPPLPAGVYAALALGTGITVLALAWLHARGSEDARERLTRTYALFATWAVLFGPASEAATYALLGPAVAFSLVHAWETRASIPTRALLVTSFLLTGPLATDLLGSAARRFVQGHGLMPLGALLYGAYLAGRTGRPDRIG